MKRYICIHGHFYQPPRENPWLESIEVQDGAYPYHDWNHRITAECYAPNAQSRILDDQGRIVSIVNNHSRISFNYGPTLLSWLKSEQPKVHDLVVQADRESRERFSGHGSAMAQAYNHMIMPLANSRDKRAQVGWGIEDFRSRYGRDPEGMWLPETAVDIESLEVMAAHGIAFTILEPRQAARMRKKGAKEWTDVSGARIDPTRAYEARLPSGAAIAVFFYDGPISKAIAFEKLLSRGENYVNRLAGAFSDQRDWPQLVHVATDGETYGHHHRFGDMALAYAIDYMEKNGVATLTNYGEYLERHPPEHEVEIVENTSWSCAHGVERWRSDCGCSTGANSGWNQKWRRPLREALNFLRDEAAQAYEARAFNFFNDPWATRDAYIRVILDRSDENLRGFLTEQAGRELSENATIISLKLLEMQRHAMLMFTSCGWFFDDISGIETIQVLRYAGRVIQLARDLDLGDFERRFLDILADAQSNLSKYGNGRRIYEEHVRTAMVDLPKVCAHYAISSLFEDLADKTQVFCYKVESRRRQQSTAGKASLILGIADVCSRVTREAGTFSYGVIHQGDHNLTVGVKPESDDDTFLKMSKGLESSFRQADFPEVIRKLDRRFEGATYSVRALFKDQQRTIMAKIMEPLLKEGEASYRQFYEYHAPMMRFMRDMNAPLPKLFKAAAAYVINADLARVFADDSFDRGKAECLIEEARELELELDATGLGFELQYLIESRLAAALEGPSTPGLAAVIDAIEFAKKSGLDINFWTSQNMFWELLKGNKIKSSDREETESVKRLGELLSVKV